MTASSALLVLAFTSACLAYSVMPEHSFQGPHKTYDGDGMRKLDHWKLGGNAVLQTNFLRLTNDRQSKRSSAWNTAPLGHDEWSATIRFRVSGVGKRLFGDGLALWYTTREHHEDGTLHGFTPTFTGFGIIFDTCVVGESCGARVGGQARGTRFSGAPHHAQKDCVRAYSRGVSSARLTRTLSLPTTPALTPQLCEHRTRPCAPRRAAGDV